MRLQERVKRLAPVVLVLLVSCLDPYDPPIVDSAINYLVVDGFINSGTKSAEVKLTYAAPLHDESGEYLPAVFGNVRIEDENGGEMPLTEVSPGFYSATSLNVSNGSKYRLRIDVAGKEYRSDPVELRQSPVLDSVTWRGAADGVTIYVDSHDVSGSTEYYQWVFTETWEYNAEFFSGYSWDDVNLVVNQRRAGDYVYVCYNSVASTRVLITSTKQNSQDVVNDFPLAFIKKGSKKISRTYSILVQQRALDEDAFNYFKNLQQTTESLGGLFDPLPREVTGNIHNVNDKSEKILGYFWGGEVQEKRIFIRHDELPQDLRVIDKINCDTDTIWVRNLSLYKNYPLNLIHAIGTPVTVAYLSSSGICVDCRLQGGKLQKPSFWPN